MLKADKFIINYRMLKADKFIIKKKDPSKLKKKPKLYVKRVNLIIIFVKTCKGLNRNP
jgi:hypothetical protein